MFTTGADNRRSLSSFISVFSLTIMLVMSFSGCLTSGSNTRGDRYYDDRDDGDDYDRPRRSRRRSTDRRISDRDRRYPSTIGAHTLDEIEQGMDGVAQFNQSPSGSCPLGNSNTSTQLGSNAEMPGAVAPADAARWKNALDRVARTGGICKIGLEAVAARKDQWQAALNCSMLKSNDPNYPTSRSSALVGPQSRTKIEAVEAVLAAYEAESAQQGVPAYSGTVPATGTAQDIQRTADVLNAIDQGFDFSVTPFNRPGSWDVSTNLHGGFTGTDGIAVASDRKSASGNGTNATYYGALAQSLQTAYSHGGPTPAALAAKADAAQRATPTSNSNCPNGRCPTQQPSVSHTTAPTCPNGRCPLTNATVTATCSGGNCPRPSATARCSNGRCSL